MATTKKRINITLSPDVEKMISKIALRDKKPQATKAAELLELAIQIEEDEVWEKLAKKRDTRKARFLPHHEIWK